MQDRIKLHITLTKEHLIAIGKITTEFAFIDLMLNVKIWNLISSKQQMGEMITADLSFAQKRDLFRALYLHKHKPDSKKLSNLDKLVKRIEQAGKERNKITHSIWISGENQKPFTISRIKSTVKRKSGFERKIEDMSAEDLEKIADSFNELANDILYF